MAWAKFKVKTGLGVKSPVNSITEELIPVGLIVPCVNPNAVPPGWLLCNGQAISSVNYPALFNLVGASVPDLTGYVVVGQGQGVGAGSSGNGRITGSNLTNRSIGIVKASSTNPSIALIHDHHLNGHTHSISHTHSYPHQHSYTHGHNNSHSHPTANQTTAGAHNHGALFNPFLLSGTNSVVRANGPVQQGTCEPSGIHSHPTEDTIITVNPSGSAFSTPATTGTFGASPAPENVSSDSSSTNTGSFGGASPYSSSQPIIAMCFIIKY